MAITCVNLLSLLIYIQATSSTSFSLSICSHATTTIFRVVLLLCHIKLLLSLLLFLYRFDVVADGIVDDNVYYLLHVFVVSLLILLLLLLYC